jgi:tetratricopeptide (TPR) repeat protein
MELLRYFLGEQDVQAEQEAAANLCTTLGGLPLAVEIAAQRVFASPRRSLGRMARSLQAAGDRLAHGISNRSVRTSFNVSWEALAPNLQRIFAFSGLFDGRPFSAAALAAAAGNENEGDELLDQLDHLVTLSMLKLHGSDRFVHHRLLADFAAEKLADQPEADTARLRYAAFCRVFAQQMAGNFDALEPEWDNLLAGVAMAHRLRAWELVTGCVDALTAPWFARARFTQARQGYRWALDAAEALDDEVRHARYAYFLAKAYLRQDDYAAARHLLDNAIAVFEAQHDQPRLADAYVDLADVALEQGDHAEASTYLAAAEALYTQLHQAVGIATVKCRQALIAYDADDDEVVRRLCEEGLGCLPPGDGAIVRSRTLRLLTDLSLRQRLLQEAAAYCEQAQVANQDVNDPTEAAAILYAQAKLDHHLGNHQAAVASAHRSAQLYAAMGDRKAVAIIHYTIARFHLRQNETAAACAAAEHSVEIANSIGDDDLTALCTSQLADIAAAIRDEATIT